MKPSPFILAAILLFTLPAWSALDAPVLEPLPYRIVFDQRITRPSEDNRICVWTPKSSRVVEIAANLNVKFDPPAMEEGEVCAAFLNDTIKEALTGVIFNETANETFADYADSGIEFKLGPPPEGMKYTRVTFVYFKPAQPPSHPGIRGMVRGGLSERTPED